MHELVIGHPRQELRTRRFEHALIRVHSRQCVRSRSFGGHASRSRFQWRSNRNKFTACLEALGVDCGDNQDVFDCYALVRASVCSEQHSARAHIPTRLISARDGTCCGSEEAPFAAG